VVASETEHGSPAASASSVDAPGTPRHIVHLLVDNEWLSAQLSVILASRGYEALCLRSSHAPLPHGWPRVVLTDVDESDPRSLRERYGLNCGDTAVIAIMSPGVRRTIEACLAAKIDDFVFKPVRVDELEARISIAMLRRSSSPAAPRFPFIDRRYGERRCGWLTGASARQDGRRVEVDARAKRVIVDGQPVSLSPRAFRILELLAAHPGTVFSSDQIIAHAWPPHSCATAEDVQQHIYLLRRSIGNGYLRTAKGFGYAFSPSGERRH